jgi:hypothetical protein
VNIKDLKTTKLEFGKWELERKQRGGRERVQSSEFKACLSADRFKVQSLPVGSYCVPTNIFL